jgi:hypothetical protein
MVEWLRLVDYFSAKRNAPSLRMAFGFYLITPISRLPDQNIWSCPVFRKFLATNLTVLLLILWCCCLSHCCVI